MTTDVLTETVLDEAEAVMRAEWVRLQDDNALCERTVCSETPPPGPAPRCTAGTYRTALSNGGDAPNDDHEWAVTPHRPQQPDSLCNRAQRSVTQRPRAHRHGQWHIRCGPRATSLHQRDPPRVYPYRRRVPDSIIPATAQRRSRARITARGNNIRQAACSWRRAEGSSRSAGIGDVAGP